MICKKTILICLALLIIGSLPIKAKNVFEKKKQDFPLSVSLSNHSWAFPFNNVFRVNPIYPGMAIGTEYYYRNREKNKLFQTAELGGFINNSSGSALYFNSNFGYRYTSKFGLMADASFGLGLYKTYHSRTTYMQQTNGEYHKVKDKGSSSLSANISFGLGYDLSKVSSKKLMPFIRYQWIAGTEYWSLIGMRPNGILQIGI